MAEVAALKVELKVLQEELGNLRQQLAGMSSAGEFDRGQVGQSKSRGKRRRQRRRRSVRGEKQEGRVKFYLKKVGWGFITDRQGVERFFHRSALVAQQTDLASGAAVTFAVRDGARGPRAVGVQLVADTGCDMGSSKLSPTSPPVLSLPVPPPVPAPLSTRPPPPTYKDPPSPLVGDHFHAVPEKAVTVSSVVAAISVEADVSAGKQPLEVTNQPEPSIQHPLPHEPYCQCKQCKSLRELLAELFT